MELKPLSQDPLIGTVVGDSIRRWETESANPSSTNVCLDYHRYTVRKWAYIAICAIALLVCCGISLTVGEYDIGFFQSYEVLWNHLIGNVGTSPSETLLDYIIVDLRLPKIVVGIVAGFALAVCGVAMQALLKNPLADPYTTGVSSGAGFGATLAIVMGASLASNEYAIVVNAFLFSLIPTVAIVLVSKIRNTSPTTMIMAGIAIMYLFNALTTIIKLWGDPESLGAVLEWQVGSIGGIEWKDVPLMVIVTAIGCLIVQLMSRKLNVLATGEENAKALGINVNRMRTLLLVLSALVAATVVSYTGIIGFIGLVAPHVSRLVIGADNRYLVPASALFGATLLIASDIIGKTIVAPGVLPVGVITAFLGAPLFLWLIIRSRREVWG